MLTFPTPIIQAVSLIPLKSEDTAGRFRVWLFLSAHESPILIWDRKIEGGFPELKALVSILFSLPTVCPVQIGLLQKQKIRDIVQPGVSLGHSDKKL